ncbi:MAG TPA: hypothetical protein DG761_07280 [Gammaproteobacteria bacterium]|nr:hypothetical protein [Gammaproteobacteria bacterium]
MGTQIIQEVFEPVPVGINVRPTLDHKCECGRRDAIVLPTAMGQLVWSCAQCQRVIKAEITPGSVSFSVQRKG